MNKIGRCTIYANYTESELLNLNSEDQKKAVLDIITNAIELHKTNKIETIALFEYWSGKQDIQSKKKETREKINNKLTENWAYAFVDFKKNWLLSKPIQYVASDSGCSDELSTLNKYCQVANVPSKNQQWYADALICGRGFKYNAPIEMSDDYESPFEVINIDPETCEVVYSSQIGHEQLLSFIETSFKRIDSDNQEKNNNTYSEYTVYLRNKKYVLSDKTGSLRIVDDKTQSIIINKHLITELYLNKERISLIEFGKDLFNGVNLLESLDMDDMEQFVNAYMVFTNADFTEEDLKNINKLGAIKINSSDSKPAKVELISQKLDANSTQNYYSRLINALHNILGIPKSGESGNASYGDTGQARLLSQGYTFAEIRIMGDQVMIEKSERDCLSTILKICRTKPKTGIKNLKIGDIAFNFQIDKSDNMLTKSETLLNLKTAGIPREIRNAVINLFSDPNAVTEAQEKTFGPEDTKTVEETTTDTENLEQNNQDAQEETQTT